MTRIGRLFECLKQENRKGLIAYLTAGDPSPLRTPALVAALVRGGADLIELGVPFSDPIADGPVIQRGGERALKAGTTLRDRARNRARRFAPRPKFRCCCSPISIPCCAMAWNAWRRMRRRAGIDGCLLTDASRGRGGNLRRRHASARPGYRLSGRAYQHGAPSQTGGAILHGLRLSGFAHRRHRRAGFALGVGGAAGPGGARGHGSAAGRGLRRLDSPSMSANWAARWRPSWWAARSSA